MLSIQFLHIMLFELKNTNSFLTNESIQVDVASIREVVFTQIS